LSSICTLYHKILACVCCERVLVVIAAHLDRADIDLCGGSDNVCLIYSLEGHSIDLEWTRYEQQSTSELLQEDNPLASESSSEEDEDGSRGDASAQFGGSSGLACRLELG